VNLLLANVHIDTFCLNTESYSHDTIFEFRDRRNFTNIIHNYISLLYSLSISFC